MNNYIQLLEKIENPLLTYKNWIIQCKYEEDNFYKEKVIKKEE